MQAFNLILSFFAVLSDGFCNARYNTMLIESAKLNSLIFCQLQSTLPVYFSLVFLPVIVCLISYCLLFIGADGTRQSIVAIRVSRPDILTASSSVDSIILTVTMPPEYPEIASGVSVSGDSLHRHLAAQLSAAVAAEAEQLIGQPMMLDKC